MKLESITNSVILNIINSLHPELPMETLNDYHYWDGNPNTEIKSLDTINLMDLILESIDKTDVPNQVIYLNTKDNLISIFEIYGDDIETEHLNENPNWHHLGNIMRDGSAEPFNLYLYIDSY